MGLNYSNCQKCHKPFLYVGDVLDWGKGQEPYCTCGEIIPVPSQSYMSSIERRLAELEAERGENRKTYQDNG
jgi:hypothetical protein